MTDEQIIKALECCFLPRVAKEFAERLNKHSVYVDDYDCFMVSAESIDNLVKEMTEPVKFEHNSLCETETYIKE